MNPPRVCFDCNSLQENHVNFHEKATIHLLNFKVGVLAFLFVSGFFVANDDNSDGGPGLTITRGNSSSEVYGTSKEEIERRKGEVDARLKQMESEQNNGLLNSPFINPSDKK